jgi:Small integral membrane protein (DUF2273)
VTSPKLIGLALGLWLGFVWVVWDFSDMILVALVGLVGYLIGRLVAGDLDLGPLAGRLGLRR